MLCTYTAQSMNMKALKISNLKKVYDTGVVALKGVDITVDEGDFFALLGPNGAGKSTLISILTSLALKTEGVVEIFGHNIDEDFSAAKACIGVVPQEFNFSIFESVQTILLNQAGYYGIPSKVAKPRVETCLKRLGLWDKRFAQSRSLSGGMKRRLMIARALIHEPKMLILDEPTAGVDIELRQMLWGFLSDLNKQGTTIILTTHYLEEAESLCRNIAIIDKGDIVENTAMSTLLQQLENETFILYLKSPLQDTPKVNGYVFRLIDELTVEVDISKESGLSNLFNELNSMKIEVKSMRNKTNRLEALFLRLTADSTNEE
jgi:ABC-2 type transport system ATP-binding protein